MTPIEIIERHAGRPGVVIAAGFLASLLFVVFGPYLRFAMVGFLDPWFYTGYFTNFANLQHNYGETYYFSRLPWTIPGLVVFSLATPEVATMLLHSFLITASTVSLYFLVRWHYGTAPAVLAAVALATNPYFYSSMAWDYPDGPAIAYGFVAAAFAIRPHGRPAVNTVLMAAFLACSGFTNMSGGPMILSILVFPLWRQRRSPAALAREAGWILAGVTAATLALMPVSRLLLGYWTFYMKQIDLARYEIGTPGVLSKMWGSGSEFLSHAYRLFPAAFILVFGLVLLVIARQRKSIAWPAWIAMAVCASLYCVQEFGLHGVALRVPYHSVYMVVPMFLLCGAILGELWGNVTDRNDWFAAGGIALFLLALPFLADSGTLDILQAKQWSDMLLAGAAALVLLIGWRSAPRVFRVPIVLLAGLLLFTGPARQLTVLNSANRADRSDYQTIMNVQSLLKPSVPADRRAIFWVDEGETHANLFDSELALFIYQRFDYQAFLGSAPGPEVRNRFLENPTLIHLTDHPEKIAARLKLLDSRGVHYENHRQWIMRYGQTQFYVAAEDITDTFSVK